MDYKELAKELLDDWNLCERARVPKDVVSLQLVKDSCAALVTILDQEYAWGNSEEDLKRACEALAPKLRRLKEKIVFEVLKDGKI